MLRASQATSISKTHVALPDIERFADAPAVWERIMATYGFIATKNQSIAHTVVYHNAALS